MPIHLDKLLTLSQKSLPLIAVIAGDEYFLMEQALKSLIHTAKAQGFSEKEMYHVDTLEQWAQAWQGIASQSLFADKKIIVLRSTLTTVPKSMQQKIEHYCQNPEPATRIVWLLPKLKSPQLKQTWLKAIEKVGALAQAWPIAQEQLPAWIKTRCHKKGLAITDEALAWFCEQVAGDISAAAQEIEKLFCLYALNQEKTALPVRLTLEHLQHAVVCNARFDVYALIDSCLRGDSAATLTIFNTLKEQHSELVLINWAITRCLRQCLALQTVPATEFSTTCTQQGIWPKQHNDFRRALQRLTVADCHALLVACQQLDENIKGVQDFDPWHVLQQICCQFAGLQDCPKVTVA